MSWPFYRETVTVMDVMETGACFSGITEWILANKKVIAGPTQDHLHLEKVAQATFSSGSGSGYGYGYGYGDGYGDGDGDGDGDGRGSGYGDGSGWEVIQ